MQKPQTQNICAFGRLRTDNPKKGEVAGKQSGAISTIAQKAMPEARKKGVYNQSVQSQKKRSM